MAHEKAVRATDSAGIVIYSVLLGAVAALIAVTLLSNFGSSKATYILFGFLSLFVFGPIMQRVLRRSLDLAEPGIWFALFYFTHFGMRAIYDLIFGSPALGLAPKSSDLTLLNAALGVSIAGLLMFWLGYLTHLGKAIAQSLPPLPPKWGRGRALQVALLCTGLGWSFRFFLVFYQAGGIAAWLKADKYILLAQAEGTVYLSILSDLAAIGLFIIFIIGKTRRRYSYWFLFSLFSIPELLWRFVGGSRAQFIFFLLGLLMASYLTSKRGHKVSRQYVKWLTVISILLFLLFPLFSIIRGGIKNPHDIFELTWEFWKSPSKLFALVAARQVGLDSLALVIDRVPKEEPYTLGSELSLLAVAWIPRIFWPDKPTISIGKVFYQKFYPPIYHEGTAVAPTLPGEFYWALGIIGVIVGMFLIGILWRFLFEYLVKPRENLSNILVVGLMFPSFFVPAEQSVVGFFTMHLFQFLLVALIALAIRGKEIGMEVAR